jgi:C1A family cysteine protease
MFSSACVFLVWPIVSLVSEESHSKGEELVVVALGAYEYLTSRVQQENLDVSRLFIYYNARMKNNPSGELTDSGCSMSSGIESLEEFGVCSESVWPYDVQLINQCPGDQAFEQAQQLKITEALQLDLDLNQMKSCLAQGYPFAFGLSLFTSFDRAAKSGVVPLPDQNETSREAHGSHAMLAVGYSDQSNSFIVRNSWGKFWVST